MKIMIILAILALFLMASCTPKEPMLGSDCGTVSPDGRDECCARKNIDAIHIMCVGSWKYNPKKECEFVCETG